MPESVSTKGRELLLLPYISPDDINKKRPFFFNACSNNDIVPIKLYEYLAMKKVVIASELPGISKEFGYGHGIEYVQKAEEVLDLAKNIIDNGQYDKIASAGREYVQNNDWEAIVDKFEKAMKNLLN